MQITTVLLLYLCFSCRIQSSGSTGLPIWQCELFMKSSSFHGAMTKKEAELTLENHGSNRCYLTRYCTTKKLYLLSTMTKQEEGYRHDHFIINIDEEILALEGTEKKFNEIIELLHFYERNPVNFEISNIGVEVSSETVSWSVEYDTKFVYS